MAAGRRQFIAGLGAAAAGAGTRDARARRSGAERAMAPDVELPAFARSDLWRRRDARFGAVRHDRRALHAQALGGRRDRAGARSARRGGGRARRMRSHRALLLLEQGPELRLWRRDAVWHEHAPARRLAAGGRRGRADRRTARRAQGFRAAGRQHRRADGGLVSQGDSHARRFRRPQAAHRRLCRQSVPDARRRAGGDGQGRYLFGARIGRARRVRMGRPLRRRSFGNRADGTQQPISKVAPNYYYPGWWKGGMQLHLVVSKDKFDALPKSYQAALRAAAARPTLRCWRNTTPPIPAR